jgi:TonB family protein
MAATSLQVPLRRRHSRYELTAPVEVTVLRSGIPQNLPGRLVDAGLGGVSVVLPGDLFPGESVGVEFRLADAPAMVQARARVRYQDRIRCGLEFSTVSADKLELVRIWTDQRYRVMVSAADTVRLVEPPEPQFLQSASSAAYSKSRKPTEHGVRESAVRPGSSRVAKLLILLAITATAVGGIWTYERFGTVKLQVPVTTVDPISRRVMVSADVMQSLITYRTMPAYPQTAERQGVQGTVLLDTVVGKDGRVLDVRPTSGPPELTGAAIDAVKNWRFSPFTLDGDAVEVETTIGVEFRISDPGPGAPGALGARPKPSAPLPATPPPAVPHPAAPHPAAPHAATPEPAISQPTASQ